MAIEMFSGRSSHPRSAKDGRPAVTMVALAAAATVIAFVGADGRFGVATTAFAQAGEVLPPLPDPVPEGRVAVQVVAPDAKPVTLADVVQIVVIRDDGMRWMMGPRPKILGRFADGWVLVDASMYRIVKPDQVSEFTCSLATGATITVTRTHKEDDDITRLTYTMLEDPKLAGVDTTEGPANVGPDEVAGRVVDPAGKPVAGAVVSLPRHDFPGFPDDPYRPSVVTDREGVFRFGDFANQWFLYLQVEAPGYGTRRTADLPVGRPFTVHLDNRTRLAGQLVLSNGAPAADTTIQLTTSKPTARERIANPISDITLITRTNADGGYDLPLEPGRYDVRVTSPTGEVARERALRVPFGQATALPMVLNSGRTVRLRAVDSVSGAPVVGARLALEERRPGLSATRSGTDRTTNAEGKVEWDHLPDGPESVVVHAEGYSRWWIADEAEEAAYRPRRRMRGIDSVKVEVVPEMSELTLLMEPAIRVSGTVLAPDGTPVAGATVDVAGLQTGDSRYARQTDAQGKFTLSFPNLNLEQSAGRTRAASQPDGPDYAIVAFDQSGHWANVVSKSITPKVGASHELTLRMTAGGRVSGRVVDAAGAPVPSIEVEAVADDEMDRQYYNPRQLTDALGRFDLGPMRPATYALIVDTNFGVNLSRQPDEATPRVTVAEGTERVDLTLTYDGPPAPPVPEHYWQYGGNRKIQATTRPATQVREP